MSFIFCPLKCASNRNIAGHFSERPVGLGGVRGGVFLASLTAETAFLHKRDPVPRDMADTVVEVRLVKKFY